MAICAWLTGEQCQSESARQLVYEVCEGFLCPSLGTAADYEGWMRDAAGFYAPDEAAGARELAEAYVAEVLRAPAGERMPYCAAKK